MLSPAEWHERDHGFVDAPPPPIEECRRCQRSVIICGGKVSYEDHRAARTAAQAINIEREWDGPVRTYRCRQCLRWHLTSRLNKHQAKRAEKHRRKTLRPA
jgi:hypothetical protein